MSGAGYMLTAPALSGPQVSGGGELDGLYRRQGLRGRDFGYITRTAHSEALIVRGTGYASTAAKASTAATSGALRPRPGGGAIRLCITFGMLHQCLEEETM
jgi:hypothetical protein